MSRVALITGGSGGIGFACAEALAARGYDLLLTARRPDRLEAAAEKLNASWVAADAADEASFATVVDAVDHVDLLVHAAGVLGGTFVRKEKPEEFDRVLRANLRSVYTVTRAVLPKMPVGGRIVYISSSAGVHGMKGRSAYSASKAGMNAFAEALADEVARDGINVNVLSVAPVETDMLEKVTFPMYCLDPSDVAAAVVFLDSLAPRVVIPEIFMRAVEEGPLAPDPVLPEAYQQKQHRQA